jgi:hypothetical protein
MHLDDQAALDRFVPCGCGAKGVENHGDSVVCRESAVHYG